MKKLVVMGLALTMALGITACSGGILHRRNQRVHLLGQRQPPQQKQGKVRKHLHRQMGMWKPRSLRYPMYLQKAIRSIRRFCRLRMNFMIRPEEV